MPSSLTIVRVTNHSVSLFPAVEQEESASSSRRSRRNRNEEDTTTLISCAANIELTPRGEVLVRYQDQVFVSIFLFRERNWPQSCTIEFEARAFQGPHDAEPIRIRYKGYFRRKITDHSVVKMIGHMYAVPERKRKRFGRGGGPTKSHKKIGTFVARRRLSKRGKLQQHKDDDDDDDEEFEDYDDDEDFEDADFDEEDEEDDDFEDDDEDYDVGEDEDEY